MSKAYLKLGPFWLLAHHTATLSSGFPRLDLEWLRRDATGSAASSPASSAPATSSASADASTGQGSSRGLPWGAPTPKHQDSSDKKGCRMYTDRTSAPANPPFWLFSHRPTRSECSTLTTLPQDLQCLDAAFTTLCPESLGNPSQTLVKRLKLSLTSLVNPQ